MNLASFGLSRRPFRPTPDTESYFSAPSHDAAVAALAAGYENRDGIALVDGQTGVGKTIVGLRFLESLPPTVPRVMIPAARFSKPSELYQAILFDIGAPYQGLSEHELRLAVTDQLLGGLASGHPTALVLDEAQHLGADLLEEIRMLGNLETRCKKAAFVVLLALPPLRDRLGGADAAAFAQRVGVRSRVEPLSREGAAGYLRHQVKACGADPQELITDEALSIFASHCGGIPRILNRSASLALALAAAAGERVLDAEAATEAVSQLGLREEPEDPNVLPHPAQPAVRRAVPAKARTPKRRSA